MRAAMLKQRLESPSTLYPWPDIAVPLLPAIRLNGVIFREVSIPFYLCNFCIVSFINRNWLKAGQKHPLLRLIKDKEQAHSS